MQSEPKNIGGGLLPKTQDLRDFSHSTVFGSLTLDEIPTYDFYVTHPMEIKDQKSLDFCPGFSTSSVNEDQEGKIFDPYWQFAKIKQITGDYKSWGADMRTAAKSLTKFGSLPVEYSPHNYKEKSRDFLANWENYPTNLDASAAFYKKESFFDIDGPHDAFDNMRVALVKHMGEDATALVGALWHSEWTRAPGGVIPLEYNGGEIGHMFKIYGQKTFPGESEPRLVAQLSNGTDIGDGGIFYFPRAVFNKEFAPFGQIMFTDMPKEKAKLYNEAGISLDDTFLDRLWKIIRHSLTCK